MPFEDEAAQKLYRVPPGYGYQKAKQKPPERKPKRDKKVNIQGVLDVPPAPVPSAYSAAPISSFESTLGTETVVQEISKLSHPLNRPSFSAQGTASDLVEAVKVGDEEIGQTSPSLPQSQPTVRESAVIQSTNEPEQPRKVELPKTSEQLPTPEVAAAVSVQANETKYSTVLNGKPSTNTSLLATVSQKNSKAFEQTPSVGQLKMVNSKPSQPQAKSALQISPTQLSGSGSRQISRTQVPSNQSIKNIPSSASTSSMAATPKSVSLNAVKPTNVKSPTSVTQKWTPPPPSSKKIGFSSIGNRFSSMISRLTGSPDLPDKKDLISAQSAAEIERANEEYEEECLQRRLEEQQKAQEAALQAKIERYFASRRGKKMLKRKQNEMHGVMRWTIETLRQFQRMQATFDDSEMDLNPELLRKLRAVQMLEILFMQQVGLDNRCSSGCRRHCSCEKNRRRRRKELCWTLVSMLQSRGIDVQGEIARDMAAIEESENEEEEVDNSSSAHVPQPE
ncbi:unnamed protein product [Schistocephalus solidus]|uniref:SANT domain-containing protein n=1 Tax=Schistocephalus solidus TaxID=70667 RepID=A0A183TP01_SCHSO|nr:unnamed protein product [Schistocephalus solidus]